MLRASLVVCGLLAAAPNCTDLYSIGAHGFAVPSVASHGAQAAAATRGLGVIVDFSAKNANPYPLELSGIDYDVAVDGSPVFSGSQGAISIAEEGEGTVGLQGVIDPSSPVLRTLQPGSSVPYVLSGIARVKTPAGVRVDVEFSTNGSFTVPPGAPWGATR